MAGGHMRTHGNALALVAARVRDGEDGEPILVPGMWLIPGGVIGVLLIAMVLLSSRKKR
jgi:hypothetical protein